MMLQQMLKFYRTLALDSTEPMKNEHVNNLWKTRNDCMAFIPLHSIISMHILYTVLYTFPKVLTKRICLKIGSFVSW